MILHDDHWTILKHRLKEELYAAQGSICATSGDSMSEIAGRFLEKKGKWLAIQSVLCIMQEIEQGSEETTEDEGTADA